MLYFEQLIPFIRQEKIAVFAKLDCGTSESFDVEIMRGQRLENCRKEYLDWLLKLNLKVRSISYCNKDTSGNENMICVFCEPIKVRRR